MLKITTDWHIPLACIAVVLLSTLYTHHTHHQKLRDCSDLPLLQELVCIQIAGIILASAAISAMKRAPAASTPLATAMLSHPMLPRAAERKRMQLPLV
jgi:uncharacterized membrane protein affecting hemolysin expression